MANITLVDDDENIVASISLALESHGHTVKAYFDGASGLAALESDPPDLVILDVKMPRMDGMEVLRRLRAGTEIPVIMLTSKDDEIDEILGFNLGADDYIHKPFSQRLLLERVRKLPCWRAWFFSSFCSGRTRSFYCFQLSANVLATKTAETSDRRRRCPGAACRRRSR